MKLEEIKPKLIEMNPSNEEWVKWVKSQKLLKNLTNGEELKTKEELQTMFATYTTKKIGTSKPQVNNTLIDKIKSIDDINLLNEIETIIAELKPKLIEKAKQEVENKTKAMINEALKYGLSKEDILKLLD